MAQRSIAIDIACVIGANVRKGCGFVPPRYSDRAAPSAGSGFVWLMTTRSVSPANAVTTVPWPSASIAASSSGGTCRFHA